MVWMFFAIGSLSKKMINFDLEGIVFLKAYGRKRIRWSEIDSIEWVREPTVAYYKIHCNTSKARPFIAIEFEKNDQFEDLIRAKNISFKKSDPLNFEGRNRNANQASEDNSE